MRLRAWDRARSREISRSRRCALNRSACLLFCVAAPCYFALLGVSCADRSGHMIPFFTSALPSRPFSLPLRPADLYGARRRFFSTWISARSGWVVRVPPRTRCKWRRWRAVAQAWQGGESPPPLQPQLCVHGSEVPPVLPAAIAWGAQCASGFDLMKHSIQSTS